MTQFCKRIARVTSPLSSPRVTAVSYCTTDEIFQTASLRTPALRGKSIKSDWRRALYFRRANPLSDGRDLVTRLHSAARLSIAEWPSVSVSASIRASRARARAPTLSLEIPAEFPSRRERQDVWRRGWTLTWRNSVPRFVPILLPGIFSDASFRGGSPSARI